MKLPRFRPVFTTVGGFFLVIALIILIRSLLVRNSYEIILSSGALFLLLILGFLGAWKSRKLKSMEAGWKPPFPMTANTEEDTLISGFDARIPVFFRLHFIIRGRFFPAGSCENSANGCPVSVETSVPRGETAARILLDFPMSGIFQGDGYCRLRDIFGFFSFSCGQPQKRTVKVRSAPCLGKKLHINAQSGAEDRRNKHSANEERYYMREYAPGDRFRDINWKSSEKIDTLITRISPDNQEKVSRIEVHFRNFGPVNRPSLDALWLLDRAKARLSHFLRSLKEEQSSYTFDVRAAAGSWEIENQDDIDAFLEELAGFSFSPPQNDMSALADKAASQGAVSTSQLYVFSTACDAGLSSFILACHPRPVSLFLVQPTAARKGTEPVMKTESEVRTDPYEPEILRIGDFCAKGCIPLPRWFVRAKIKHMGAHADKVEISCAGTKL